MILLLLYAAGVLFVGGFVGSTLRHLTGLAYHVPAHVRRQIWLLSILRVAFIALTWPLSVPYAKYRAVMLARKQAVA